MAKIITIAGRAGAGKDTFAELLSDALAQRGFIVNTDRFAAPLKAASLRVFGPGSEDRDRKEVAVDVPYTTAMRASHDMLGVLGLRTIAADNLLSDILRPFASSAWALRISPREYQQLMGTELVRRLDRDAWVMRLLRDSRRADADFVVVPDYRFHNEGVGTSLLVYRPGLPVMQHASEAMATELYALIEASAGGYPANAVVRNRRVIWNVQDEHLLWLQADLLASTLKVAKSLKGVQ